MKRPESIEAAVETIEALNARTAADDVRIGELEAALREVSHAKQDREAAHEKTLKLLGEMTVAHNALRGEAERFRDVAEFQSRRADLNAQLASQAINLHPDAAATFRDVLAMDAKAKHEQLIARVEQSAKQLEAIAVSESR